MTLKAVKAAPRHKGTASGNALASTARSSGYVTLPALFQEPADMVGILAARSRVAAATVRAHVEAFGLGGRQ